ncbi:hypothetical protein EDF56_1095 [Novosphingobium sp. PhB165]|uniref:hypothetical protein n=1 Tax=Novosphingobium sp. PhB165 TaxID=2485105 RepID=UPI00104C3F54|nr:hypothetical protein [Novosphingobium sp. PhB165]TCM15677.1 hypothetical protein EDF56_1095 [Novosphingobium sp. PhB165]
MPDITISMFNVGFGDCFLVEIPFPEKMCRILFDCGRHKGGADENQKLAERVIAAAGDSDGSARIDLVVGTHRHKDHVSGFAASGWDKVQVAEVWMPWTENPQDPAARGMVERQVRSAALARMALAPALAAAPNGSAQALAGADAMLSLALSNEAAMDTLYSGFAGKPVRRYLPDADAPQVPLGLAGFPGLRFHVMGPSRDAAALAVMDPPRAETFRHLAMAQDAAGSGQLSPFPARCRIDPEALSPRQRQMLSARLSAADMATIRGMSDGVDLVGLAAEIDAAINNTSLVILIEVGAARLLFCADAQWGNWKSILADPHWCDLIRETTFLKVGHHASHNASPVTLIDTLLPKSIPAMVSVDPKAYSNVPYQGLVDEMKGPRAMNVVRSDLPAQAQGVVRADADVIVMKVPF